MPSLRSGLVDIIRDFLAVDALATRLVSRHEAGAWRFDDVRSWVGDDARSPLFRLKEGCHAIFRATDADETPEMRTGALLDLAVDSLFHEAMKLRENLYQQERYGPRVQALRGENDSEARELFAEFEKILAQTAQSLDVSVGEVAALLDQTRKQLRRSMIALGATGITARCLYEHQSELASVYAEGVDALFADIFGDAATGYVRAALSYLESAYYAEALPPLEEAARRAPDRKDVAGARAYAQGMLAFFSREYATSVARLGEWLDTAPGDGDAVWVRQALAGTQHIERLMPDDESEEVIADAAALSEQLRALEAR